MSHQPDQLPKKKLFLGLGAGMAILFGGILFLAGLQESGKAEATSEPAVELTLAELSTEGPGNRMHVELRDFRFGEGFVVEEDEAENLLRAWIPLFAPNGDEPRVIAEIEGGRKNFERTMRERTLRGIVEANREPFGATIGQKLREQYPDIDADDEFYMFEQVRSPPGSGAVTAMFWVAYGFLGTGVLMLVLAVRA